MEPILAGHAAARALAEAGVPWVTGVSGESFLPLLDGLRIEGIPFVPVVQESGAAFMAVAYARASGNPAVVAVTRGPGASNALIGIHEAAQSNAPVVLLVGQLESSIRGRRALQEMEFSAVFGTVAKAVHEVTSPERVAPSIVAALRESIVGAPGPVVVSLPSDHLYGAVGGYAAPLPEQRPAWPALSTYGLVEISDLITNARRGLLIAGAPFAGLREMELLANFASATGFGIIGGHAFPDVIVHDDPYWLGCSTIRGPAALKETLEQADTILLAGHWLGDRVTQGYLPLEARIASITNYPAPGWDEYPQARFFPAAPQLALRQITASASGSWWGGAPERAAWVRARRNAIRAEAQRVQEAASSPAGDAVPYPAIVGAVDAALPADVTVVADAGSFNDWFMRYLPFRPGRRYLGPISGSMGFGVPAGIGAVLATDSPSLVLAGDGGFSMTAMELATLARQDLPVTVLAMRNGIWGSIAIHQDRFFPDRRFAIDLPEIDLVGLARSLGVEARRVESVGALQAALAAAFASGRPQFVEVLTDPERPSPTSY